jgi:hypothetical protein
MVSAAAAGGAILPDIIRPSTYNLDSGQAFSMVVVFITMVLIILIILYIIYMIKTQNYSKQIIVATAQRVDSTIIDDKTSLLKNPPDSTFTCSFWLYLSKFTPQDAKPEMMWYSSSESSGLVGSDTAATFKGDAPTPMVFMDSRTNRLYLSYLLTYSNSQGQSAKAVTPSLLSDLIPSYNNTTGDMRSDANGKSNPYVTIPIEYFPINRWVHVASVVQSNSATVYLDGDVYAVRSVSDLDNSTYSRPIFNTKLEGKTYFSSLSNKTPTIFAYLSSLVMYNYALNQKDIRHIYNGGPHASAFFLSRWLGIGYLYFQWPVKYVPASEAERKNQIAAV